MNEFIKKLIERLEAEKGNEEAYCMDTEKRLVRHWNICIDNTIEIVNELAEEYNNGFCEWKSEKQMFIQNPHTGRKFSNEPSMKNIYCCTCGKKIRVISAEQPDSTTEAWKQRTMSRFERVF